MPKALVTGITGQDGSYLAEYLLEIGYQVVGMVRRSSTVNFDRIRRIQDRVMLVQGDLLDQVSLIDILREHQPDEVYNLAAQSFVPTSWKQPVFTAEATALGVTRLLDAVRTVNPEIRFYQASSSEMFGKVREVPQNENTPFYPRSPYGVAKVYGHWITVNYRESYDLFAVSGILFNHECVTAETPVIIRRNGLLDILPIEDVVPHRSDPSKGSKYTTEPPGDSPLEVWDAQGWAQVTCMTATWNGFERKPNKAVYRIAAHGAAYHATANHLVFACDEDRSVDRRAEEVREGDKLALIDLPPPTNAISMTEEEAWLLGVIAADGYVSPTGKIQVTNQDEAFLDGVMSVWRQVTGGNASTYIAPSGFETGQPVTQLRLTGANHYGRYICNSLYTRSSHKRIPARVLNASYEARLAFLRGFNAGDGLKSAHGTYEFQGFKTNSAAMAAGLYWLALTTLHQRAIICLEERNDRLYYQINLNSPDVPGQKGQHLRRSLDEVVKTAPIEYQGWLFDLATTTGTFHAGVGQGWIHNSPRRGLEFVTRKVTYNVARIKLGMADRLGLGNLDSHRDWGWTPDYVRAMWLMLQPDQPQDFVIATGKTHSVRRLCEVAFGALGLKWEDYVYVDPRNIRPADVDMLVGDAAKAKEILGWEPTVTFEEMIRIMAEADLELLRTDPHRIYA